MRNDSLRRRTTVILGCLALGLFGIPAAPSCAEDSTLRRERLEKMTATERAELRSKQERFSRLDPSEQEALRKLDKALNSDPRGDQLRDVMIRYQDWLRTLPTSRRMEIVSAPPEQRVDRIKAILAEQDEQRRKDLAIQALSHEDADTVRNWMRDIIKRIEPELLASLSDEQRKAYEEAEESRMKLMWLIETVSRKRGLESDPFRFETVLKINEEDRQKLVQMLSPSAQTIYRQKKDETERKKLVQSWNKSAAFREKFRVSPEELRQFLERADPNMRERLENLPHDQMRAELERQIRYERMRMMGDGGGPGPKGRFPGPLPPRKSGEVKVESESKVESGESKVERKDER